MKLSLCLKEGNRLVTNEKLLLELKERIEKGDIRIVTPTDNIVVTPDTLTILNGNILMIELEID